MDVKTVFFYYDTMLLGPRFRKRAEIMILEGALDEFLEIDKAKKLFLAENSEAGEKQCRKL